MSAPKKDTSLAVSKTPIQQPTTMLQLASMAEEEESLEMDNDMAMEIVGTAFTKVMEGHFAKLYSKIDNLKTEVSTLNTTFARLVEENEKLGEVRGNVPDPEMQPPATPVTPTNDLTIRLQQVLPALRKRVGTPLARVVTTRNCAKQVEKDNMMVMNIDQLDAEPGRPGKASRLLSPPPSLMHSPHAEAPATATRREDDRGENDIGGCQRRACNPRQRQGQGRSEGSCDQVT